MASSTENPSFVFVTPNNGTECPDAMMELYFCCHPFAKEKVCLLYVDPNQTVRSVLDPLAQKLNQLCGFRIPFPRLELISVDTEYWLDPRKTWNQYGIQHGELRPLWPIAHGPVDDPDTVFGRAFYDHFAKYQASDEQKSMIQQWNHTYTRGRSAHSGTPLWWTPTDF